MVEFFFAGLFTGHDPTRELGQEIFKKSRVGSGGVRNLTGRVRSSRVGSDDPTHADPGKALFFRGVHLTVVCPEKRGSSCENVSPFRN